MRLVIATLLVGAMAVSAQGAKKSIRDPEPSRKTRTAPLVITEPVNTNPPPILDSTYLVPETVNVNPEPQTLGLLGLGALALLRRRRSQ